MSKGHAALKFLRKVHLYIGIFTSPALLFFAITGASQTFNLHETTQGSSYKPPAWIASLAQLHKKQTTVVPQRRMRPAGPENGPHAVPENAASENANRDQNSAEAASHGSVSVTTGPADAARTPRTGEAATPSVSPTPRKNHFPMKIFFLLVSLSLVISTLTGMYLSDKYSRGWWVLTGLLVAGVVLPVLLLPF
jgi:hypothetical protein